MCGEMVDGLKSCPCNMIRACGSRWMRLKKVSTIFDHYLKHAQKANTVLSRDCGKDAEHTEERQIHFTMKNMKRVKENLGTPLSVAAFLISPFRRPTPRRWITPGEPPVASKRNNFLFAVPQLRDWQFLLTFVNAKAWV